MIIKEYVKKIKRKFTWDNWNLVVCSQSISEIINTNKIDLDYSQFITFCKKISFIADPFIVKDKETGIYYVFAEYYDIGKGRGYINLYSLASSKLELIVENIFDDKTHSSYPFIFKDNKTYYAIRENSISESISIYKAVSFPTKWEKYSTIIDGVKVNDPTIYKIEGVWYLWGTDATLGPNNLLLLYYSLDLHTGWLEHPKSPIKSDLRTSRPAGNIIFQNGIYYRPSQNCSKTYGNSIIINEICDISPSEYSEIERCELSIINAPLVSGFHTITFVDSEFVIIDVKQEIFSYNRIVLRLRRLFKNEIDKIKH